MPEPSSTIGHFITKGKSHAQRHFMVHPFCNKEGSIISWQRQSKVYGVFLCSAQNGVIEEPFFLSPSAPCLKEHSRKSNCRIYRTTYWHKFDRQLQLLMTGKSLTNHTYWMLRRKHAWVSSITRRKERDPYKNPFFFTHVYRSAGTFFSLDLALSSYYTYPASPLLFDNIFCPVHSRQLFYPFLISFPFFLHTVLSFSFIFVQEIAF